MEINGKIIQVFTTKSGVSAKTGKEWASQDAVLEIPGQYARHMLFTIFGEENIQRDEPASHQQDCAHPPSE